jgi:hypothetical protein
MEYDAMQTIGRQVGFKFIHYAKFADAPEMGHYDFRPPGPRASVRFGGARAFSEVLYTGCSGPSCMDRALHTYKVQPGQRYLKYDAVPHHLHISATDLWDLGYVPDALSVARITSMILTNPTCKPNGYQAGTDHCDLSFDAVYTRLFGADALRLYRSRPVGPRRELYAGLSELIPKTHTLQPIAARADPVAGLVATDCWGARANDGAATLYAKYALSVGDPVYDPCLYAAHVTAIERPP